MSASRMYIDKFGREVLIDDDHPLAVEQRATDAHKKTEPTRLVGDSVPSTRRGSKKTADASAIAPDGDATGASRFAEATGVPPVDEL